MGIPTHWIVLERHYNRAVDFLCPVDDYKRKTPDIVMNGQLWEIKSPIRKSKNTIKRQIKRAVKQSCNIIVDKVFSAVVLNYPFWVGQCKKKDVMLYMQEK